MLPASLRLLLRLQLKARVRRLFRGAKTIKGALYLLVTFGLFLLWIGSLFVQGFVMPRVAPESVRPYVSSGIFAYCLLTLFTIGPDQGIIFWPPEVDFLFPGPYRRRDLVIYRLTSSTAGCLVLAIFLSVMLLRYAQYWVAGAVGLWLVLLFVTFFSIAMALTFSLVAEEAFSRWRKVVFAAVGLLVLIGLWRASQNWSGGDWMSLMGEFRQTWVGTALLAPCDVFARTITARSLFPEFVTFGLLAAAIDAVMLAIVLRLDGNFMETSIRTSQKIHDRLQRARTGGAIANLVKAKDSKLRIPRLPRLGGAGTIAWRQALTAARAARGMLLMLLIIGGIAFAPALLTVGGRAPPTVAVFMPVLMMSIFFLPQMLQFDFRGDVDRIDLLKSLPISPLAVATGELVTPIGMACSLQALLLCGLAVGGVVEPWMLALAAICLLPLNLLLFGIENLVFLLYPYRPGRIGPGDMQALGRQMLVMCVKFFVFGVTAGLAAGLGGLLWWLGGESQIGFWVGAVFAAFVMGLALVPLNAVAFRRFDPSRDTPD